MQPGIKQAITCGRQGTAHALSHQTLHSMNELPHLLLTAATAHLCGFNELLRLQNMQTDPFQR
jgi:hypothetical protein